MNFFAKITSKLFNSKISDQKLFSYGKICGSHIQKIKKTGNNASANNVRVTKITTL